VGKKTTPFYFAITLSRRFTVKQLLARIYSNKFGTKRHRKIINHYVTLWPRPLTISKRLQCIGCHKIKLPAKFQWNRSTQTAELLRFNMFNWAAVRYLAFDRKWIFTILRPPGIHIAPAGQLSTQWANARPNFHGPVFRGNLVPTIFQSWGATLFVEETRQSLFLHRCMQCRRGLGIIILSVRPSVCLSVKRVHCDKTEERSVKIFVPYERSFSLVFWEEEWLVGWPLKFWVNRPPLERNRRLWTDIRSQRLSCNT